MNEIERNGKVYHYLEDSIYISDNNEIYVNNGYFKVINIDLLKKVVAKYGNYPIEILYNLNNTKFVQENFDYLVELVKNDYKITFNGVDLKDIIKSEMFMQNIVKAIESKNFSQFEKYIATYTIASSIKKYKKSFDKNGNRMEDERTIYGGVLRGDFIVCAGFVNFLKELCCRLEIPALVHTNPEVTHGLNYVYIKDDKYKIDGIIEADPTNDNSLNSYRYLCKLIDPNLALNDWGILGYDEIEDFCKKIDPNFRKRIGTEEYDFFMEHILRSINYWDVIEAIMKVQKTMYKNLDQKGYDAIKDEITEQITGQKKEVSEEEKQKLEEEKKSIYTKKIGEIFEDTKYKKIFDLIMNEFYDENNDIGWFFYNGRDIIFESFDEKTLNENMINNLIKKGIIIDYSYNDFENTYSLIMQPINDTSLTVEEYLNKIKEEIKQFKQMLKSEMEVSRKSL